MFALIDGRVMLTGATSSPDIGGGSVTSTIDFLDEELIALIEDA